MKLTKADTHPAWCGGCGNFSILKAFDEAIAEAQIDTRKLVVVSGIGQAAKLPHYPRQKVNVFNGLHGRAIPAAMGIKISNHQLEVVITSGDGWPKLLMAPTDTTATSGSTPSKTPGSDDVGEPWHRDGR